MATVNETVDSGINPIFLVFSKVKFFESSERLLRTTLAVGSLELGVLGFEQYRFVARRSVLGNQLVKRHLEKIFRAMPELLSEYAEISCVTLPVYAKTLSDGALASMLIELCAFHPSVPLDKICIEVSADILYEDIAPLAEQIRQIRTMGVKVAISEVGDAFCPIFRLSELAFDYAILDPYATASLGGENAERICGSLVQYLHQMNAKVIAPLSDAANIEGAKAVGVDGCSVGAPEYAEGGAENE